MKGLGFKRMLMVLVASLVLASALANPAAAARRPRNSSDINGFFKFYCSLSLPDFDAIASVVAQLKATLPSVSFDLGNFNCLGNISANVTMPNLNGIVGCFANLSFQLPSGIGECVAKINGLSIPSINADAIMGCMASLPNLNLTMPSIAAKLTGLLGIIGDLEALLNVDFLAAIDFLNGYCRIIAGGGARANALSVQRQCKRR